MFWRIKKAVLGVMLLGIAASIGTNPGAGVILDMVRLTGISSEMWAVIFIVCSATMFGAAIIDSYTNLVFYAPLFFYAGIQIARSISAAGALTPAIVVLSTIPVNIVVDFCGEYLQWRNSKAPKARS